MFYSSESTFHPNIFGELHFCIVSVFVFEFLHTCFFDFCWLNWAAAVVAISMLGCCVAAKAHASDLIPQSRVEDGFDVAHDDLLCCCVTVRLIQVNPFFAIFFGAFC